MSAERLPHMSAARIRTIVPPAQREPSLCLTTTNTRQQPAPPTTTQQQPQAAAAASIMSTTMRTTLQTVPESLPADHVTSAQGPTAATNTAPVEGGGGAATKHQHQQQQQPPPQQQQMPHLQHTNAAQLKTSCRASTKVSAVSYSFYQNMHANCAANCYYRQSRSKHTSVCVWRGRRRRHGWRL